MMKNQIESTEVLDRVEAMIAKNRQSLGYAAEIGNGCRDGRVRSASIVVDVSMHGILDR